MTIEATYDEMNPENMKWMADQVKNGRFFLNVQKKLFLLRPKIMHHGGSIEGYTVVAIKKKDISSVRKY